MNNSRAAANETPQPEPSRRSPAAVAADNLFRRVLKVSNPYDAGEMAQGLTRFYSDEARELELEQAGLPFYRVETARPPARDREGPIGAELEQAKDDVDRDFTALLHNPLLKDIYPELRGWQSAIGGIIAEGIAAAPFALDPRQRDHTFSARRQLSSYARVIRAVGALTPDLNQYYRRLAQSLDEVASVLLVMTGEALAGAGFAGGTFLLQTPASELHARRDAVLMALRNLSGTVQHAHGPAEWPHGLDGYRALVRHLDRSGQSDLRSLLDEATLVQLMDGLLDLASANNAESLRALGVTAMPTIERLQRFVRAVEGVANIDSPPLSSFEIALELFYNSFLGTGNGARLMSIARPAILSYGLFGLSGPDPATQRLQQIVILRNRLAALLDCYLGCSCDVNRLRGQIILDKILADVDHAINLYCASTTPPGNDTGEAEIRSAAYGCLIATVLRYGSFTRPVWMPTRPWLAPQAQAGVPTLTDGNVLAPADPRRDDPAVLNRIRGDTSAAITLVAGTPAGFLRNVFLDGPVLPDYVARWLPSTLLDLAMHLLSGLRQPAGPLPQQPDPNSPAVDADQQIVVEMLSMQEDAEAQWAGLLSTMAPSCHLPEDIRRTTLYLIWLTRLEWCGQARAQDVIVEIPPTTASVIHRSTNVLGS